jgi:predicted ribosome quality control (RQC) complex YloA/Tae2 family protein
LLTAVDEDLIKYGLEEDVWFHADKLSSAHIYLRMKEGETWENISEEVLIDCAQLTKANSIEGRHFSRARVARDTHVLQATRRIMSRSSIRHGQI